MMIVIALALSAAGNVEQAMPLRAAVIKNQKPNLI
jgi:hypothetical protein